MEVVSALPEVVQVVIGDNNEILECVGEDGQPYVIPQMEAEDRSEPAPESPGEDGGEDSFTEELMKADAVRLLIAMIPECMEKNKLSPRTFPMKRVWETIHQQFQERGFNYPLHQIRNKWTTLTRAYRNFSRAEPGSKKKPRKRCSFHKELTDLMSQHLDLRQIILRPTKTCDAKSEDDDGNDSGSDDVMSNKAVRLLISHMVEGMVKMKSSKTMTMKDVFDAVKTEFESHGYNYTRVQICNKWKTLRRAYRRVVESEGRRGGPKSCPFQSELAAGLASCPELMQVGHRGKIDADQRHSEDEEDDDDDGGEEEYRPRGSRKLRKRACVLTPNRKRCYSPSDSYPPRTKRKKVAPTTRRRSSRVGSRRVQEVRDEEEEEGSCEEEEDLDMTPDAIRLIISMMPGCIRRKRTSRNYLMSDVWITIRDELERSGHSKYPTWQIRNKWKTLERGYKRAHLRRQRGAAGGRGRNTCAYAKELDEALSIYSKIMPSLMTEPEKRGLDIDDGDVDDDSCATPNVGEQASLPAQDRGSWFWDGQDRYLSSRGEWRKRVTVATELAALRALIADNYVKKREESARRHREKLALLAELFTKRGQNGAVAAQGE